MCWTEFFNTVSILFWYVSSTVSFGRTQKLQCAVHRWQLDSCCNVRPLLMSEKLGLVLHMILLSVKITLHSAMSQLDPVVSGSRILAQGLGWALIGFVNNFRKKSRNFLKKACSKSLIFHLSNLMEPVQVGSKLKCSDIAAETLETLPGMNDINTQIQIRSIISAPLLHPKIAPPPVSAFSNGDLG